MTGSAAVVEAEDLEVRYHGGPEPAVRGVSLALAAGEGLLVSGSAGSGKTSLLRGLLGMVEHRGRAAVLGAPVGAPSAVGSVEKLYCVFAMQTGKCPYPASSQRRSCAITLGSAVACSAR